MALGAFGLESEIDKRAFVRKVLEDGTTDPALARQPADRQGLHKLSAAFGFGDTGGARTGEPGFAAKITAAYKTRAFEVAVGDSDNNMRLAMNFRREIADLAQGAEGGSWYSILGSKPLRQVIEKAFGLPSAFGQIDIDQQRDVLRDKTSAMFGTDKLTAFQDPAAVEKVINRFLARAQIEDGANASSPAAAALTLLRSSSSSGSDGILNLILSRS